MSMKKTSTQTANVSAVVDIVMAKYRVDPSGLRQCMPEVAELLDRSYPTGHGSENPYGLTENERENRLTALQRALEETRGRCVSRSAAIGALEHCAVLTEDDHLPENVDRRTIMRLLGIVLGKALSDITSATTSAVQQTAPGVAVYQIALVRGAVLNLDRNRCLISVTVSPKRAKDGSRAMRLTEIGKHTSCVQGGGDVAQEGRYATA